MIVGCGKIYLLLVDDGGLVCFGVVFRIVTNTKNSYKVYSVVLIIIFGGLL